MFSNFKLFFFIYLHPMSARVFFFIIFSNFISHFSLLQSKNMKLCIHTSDITLDHFCFSLKQKCKKKSFQKSKYLNALQIIKLVSKEKTEFSFESFAHRRCKRQFLRHDRNFFPSTTHFSDRGVARRKAVEFFRLLISIF